MPNHRRRIAAGSALALLILTVTQTGNAQAAEYRGFWADVWHVGFKSTSAIDSMVSRAVTGRYNAIFAEVLPYQDNASGSHGAYWNSSIVPKATDISGGIDPLAYLVQQAHANGIEVHVWLVPFRACLAWPPAGNGTLAAHPEWLMVTQGDMGGGPAPVDDGDSGTTDEYTLDPGSPDVQEYLISIVRELVTNYAIDGIHWDYIRYEQTDEGYPANTSYAKSGLARFKAITGYSGTPAPSYGPWNDFRRREITELVRRARAEIPSITSNPRQPVKNTTALITWGDAPSSFTGSSAYQRFQNWEEWLRLGFVDAGVLMCYYNETQYPSYYRHWVDKAIGWRYQRHMIVGPALYLNSFANSVTQMQYARSDGANGLCTYDYYETKTGSVNDWTWYTYVASNFFTSSASVPTMPWRSSGTATEGTLWGRVTDGWTGLPIDDASVQVGSLAPVKTDGNGYYVVTLISASSSGTNYGVSASKSGYPTGSHASVQVVAGSVRRDDFALGGSGTPPPVVTVQPVPQSVAAGSTATFTVTATGQGTLTYQWQKNDVSLSNGGHYGGVTTTTLTITGTDVGDAANYRCAVTNAGGTTFSNEAALTLQGTGGAEFIVESRTGGQNFTNYSEVGTWSSSTGKSTASGVTVGIGSRYAYISASGQDAQFAFTPTATGLYEVFATWPSSTNTPQYAHHIVTHAAGSAELYLDENNNTNPGASTRWNSMGQFLLNAGTQYTVTVTTTGSTAGSGSTALRADAVKWVLLNTTQPPAITQQPSAQDVCPATTASYTVAATGEGTLAYQWRKNGTDMTNGGHYAGVTTATLTVSFADASDVANYLCVVSNASGSTNSDEAALTLKAATAISGQPAAQSVCAAATATFSVAASGEGTVAYQWQKNGANLSNGGHYSGTTTDTLTISTADGNDAASYRCVVTAGCGSVTSNAASLTIRAATTVTLQPAARNVCAGSTATFTVGATGDGTVSYRWQKNGADLNNGGHYSGVTTATLTVSSADGGDAASYRCVATAGCGSTTSNAAALTIKTATAITQQPLAQSVCAGSTATFTVSATGDGTLSYQWQKNSANLSNGGHYSGVTTAMLTVSSADGNDAANYRCVITAGCGSATSTAVALTIATAITITQQPVAQSVCPGSAATFTVAATGGTLSYQWQKNGANLADGGHYSGTTTATLTVSNVDGDDAANYRCLVMGGCGSATSNAVGLSFKPATTVTQQPLPQQACTGGTAVFAVAGTGDGTLSYRWQKDGVNLNNGGHYSGVTTPALLISDADGTDVANYGCVVTAGCGSAASSTAGLTLKAGCAVDLDHDCDVDLDDFTLFRGCFNGPNRVAATGCTADADFDDDGDVDLNDFAIFRACFNGPNRPPGSGCQ